MANGYFANVLLIFFLCSWKKAACQTGCSDPTRPGASGICTDLSTCQTIGANAGYLPSTNSIDCMLPQVCCLSTGNIINTTPFPAQSMFCSVSRNNGTIFQDPNGGVIIKSMERMGRILGGTQVLDLSRHCWIAGVFLNNQLVASGALVSPNVVITAYSPVQRATSQMLTVRLGQQFIGTTGSGLANVFLQVSQIVRYPGYRTVSPPGYPVGNLAVLRLTQPVDFNVNPSVCTACLPGQSASVNTFLGEQCHVAGYGSTGEGSSVTDGTLREVMVPVIPKAVCSFVYQRLLNQPAYATDAASMCAGGESGKDTCSRDGGAPLRCYSNARQYATVAGLSSWGIGCGRSGIPSVYVDLSNKPVFDFIQQQVSASGTSLFSPPISTFGSGFQSGFDNGQVSFSFN